MMRKKEKLKVAMIVAGGTRYVEMEVAKGAIMPAGTFVTQLDTGTFSAESTVDFNDYVLVDIETKKDIPWNTWDIQKYERLGLYPKSSVMHESARIVVMAELIQAHSRAGNS